MVFYTSKNQNIELPVGNLHQELKRRLCLVARQSILVVGKLDAYEGNVLEVEYNEDELVTAIIVV